MNLQLARTPVETALRSCLRFTILIGVTSAFLLISGCATQAPVEEVKEAVEDCYKRLLAPSIENDIRNDAKERADTPHQSPNI